MIARIWRGAVRRDFADRCEFVMLTVWESMEAVVAFAGPEPERAVFYPEDDRYLIERDLQVTHYDVQAAAGFGEGAPG